MDDLPKTVIKKQFWSLDQESTDLLLWQHIQKLLPIQLKYKQRLSTNVKAMLINIYFSTSSQKDANMLLLLLNVFQMLLNLEQYIFMGQYSISAIFHSYPHMQFALKTLLLKKLTLYPLFKTNKQLLPTIIFNIKYMT